MAYLFIISAGPIKRQAIMHNVVIKNLYYYIRMLQNNCIYEKNGTSVVCTVDHNRFLCGGQRREGQFIDNMLGTDNIKDSIGI